MTAPAFDLQSHSLCSDGELPPAEVVARSAEAGVELLALTDHDTVEGVDEALAAASEHGVALVIAAELSAVHAGYEDLHVLGYGIDHHDEVLRERLEDARADRGRRAEEMGARLRELGYEIDDRALELRREAGKPIGRPHLSAAVVSHPANRERLEREELAELTPFLVEYLIPGKAAYVPRSAPTVEDAIGWIHAAGGVAIWAHPFWDMDDAREVLASTRQFAAWGVDGVEVFYPAHGREQVEVLAGVCGDLGLLMTGSSDYHGPDHKIFAGFRAFELHGHEPVLGPIDVRE